jgi:hypothetical protein
MIKSRRKALAEHVECVWKRRGTHTGFLWESQKERDHQEVLE